MRGVLRDDPNIDHAALLSKIEYDPDTGLFKNKIARNSHNTVGKIAGGKRKCSGYLIIQIDSYIYLGHRLAWFYMNGVWPKERIDHIDGNGSNNRYVNLREATSSQNCGNQTLRKSNTNGYKGVAYHSRCKKFQARIGVNYKRYSLGYFDTIQEAAEAYDKAAIEHFGEFALTNAMIQERLNS